MPSLYLSSLRAGLNNYYYYQNAVISLKNTYGEDITIKVSDNDFEEKRTRIDNKGIKYKSIFKPGIGFKEWANNKLITNEKYSPDTIRSRVGLSKYKTKLFGFDVVHIQKRYSRGSFGWEEVYWGNGQLMYKYSKSQKKGEIYRPDGKIWCQYSGELRWGYLGSNCVLSRWGDTKLKVLYEDGPNFETPNNASFVWFDKLGRIIYKGQYQDRQKSGVWINNRKEHVYIRGVSVPKELADANPEEIDVYRVIQEKNAQLRAVLIEKISMNRIINELRGEVIDEDKQNDFSLINIRLAAEDNKNFNGDKVINLLKVKCPSTQAYYTLRVPPGIKDVFTARQWTFGVEIDQEFKIRDNVLEFITET